MSKEYGGRQLNLGLTSGRLAEECGAEPGALSAQTEGEGYGWRTVAAGSAEPGALGGDPPGVRSSAGRSGHGCARTKLVETAGDGLITNTAGVLLGIKVADCMPVIVADRKRKAVGVFHAGWRGTVQRIVEKGIGEMRRQLGCDPEDLLAVIGPGIGGCCYEIGEEVENEFDSQFAYSKELFEDVFDSWSLKTKYPMLFLNQRAPGHGEPAMSRHLDLVKANWCQLLDAGVPAENIQSMNQCTACHTDLFFSYRKEQVTGRMLAVVGIR